MVALPNPTVDAVWAAYETRGAAEARLPRRLGASEVGHECARRLWYSFRNALPPQRHEGRMLRLFDTGHQQEARIIADLRAAGIEVWDRDPSTGAQFEYTSVDGHFVAKIDGVVLGLPEAPKTPHVLSCKSASNKNFNAIVKHGTEKEKPVYFAQSQAEMGLAGLERTALVVVNKDTDDLHLERIAFDSSKFKRIMDRAAYVVRAESPPEKISQDPEFWQCRMCPFKAICQGPAFQMPRVSCRTCVHSSPAPGGAWACANSKAEVAGGAGCDEHVLIPALLEGWARPTDGDPSWVRYETKDGRSFVNVAASGFPALDVPHLSSQDISDGKASTIDPVVAAAVSLLGGEVVSTTEQAWVREP